MEPAKAFSHPAFAGKFGVARRDIAPPPGIYSRNWGAAKLDIATSIHRPLTLTVLTIQDGAECPPLVLLSMDLGWWRSSEEEKVLNEAVRNSGIERYVIALSHTHSGPVFCPGDFGKPGGENIGIYLRQLCTGIREAIHEAIATAREGILEAAPGLCPLATNRDLRDPETGDMLLGWNPVAKADHTLLLGRVSDREGRCLATLVNYACHPTILAWDNTAISPDFVGAMREKIEAETGAPCLFLQGASGDLAPRHQYVGDPRLADQAGLVLAHAALSIFASMLSPGHELAYTGKIESGAPLARWDTRRRKSIPTNLAAQSVPVELTIKEDLPSETELLHQIAGCLDRAQGEQLQRKLLLRKSLGERRSHPATHQLWKLGDILFVSVPNEAYSILQTALRETSDPTPLFVVTLANGGHGYLSPRESYEHHAYASWQSPYASGCLEQTIHHLQLELKKFL